MTPSPPGLRRRFGERAAVIEMFFTPPSARASAQEFFLTGESITGAPGRPTKQGTWSLTTTGLFVDAERKAASRRWLPVRLSPRERGRSLRGVADANQACLNLQTRILTRSRARWSAAPMLQVTP